MLKKIAVAALCLAAGLVQAAQSRWTITDLGNSFNPIYGGVYATSVNNRGEVSGWAYSGQYVPEHHAFTWENGTLTDLGVPANSYDSAVYGLNNRGTYVGNSGGYIAYFTDGAWTKLTVPGSANDVNDSGTIVGAYNGSGTRPFMIKDGVFTDLGLSFGVAFAVNRKDVIVGYTYDSAFHPSGWIYEAGAFRFIGTLGGTDSYAFDINDHGAVVGASSDAAGHVRAVIYEGGAMRRVESVSQSYSQARSINDHGDIVGTIDGHGFMLARDGTLTMLEQLPEIASQGWQYLQPMAISDRGWIVGTGWHNGSGRSFLIKPK